jgi:hypothetical protein
MIVKFFKPLISSHELDTSARSSSLICGDSLSVTTIEVAVK